MRTRPTDPAAIHDLLVHTIDADGNPRPGWYRIRSDQRARFYDSLLGQGLDARRSLPATSVRRAEIEDSVRQLLKHPGIVPEGPYPNIDGTMTIVERATPDNLNAARARDQLAQQHLSTTRR